LTISWEPQDSKTYDIDFFEAHRRPTRQQEELSIPFDERIRLLKISGVSNEEIDEVMFECEKIQTRREKSAMNTHWDFLAAASESLGRTLKKASKLRNSRQGRNPGRALSASCA
jgi:hypothetical protein